MIDIHLLFAYFFTDFTIANFNMHSIQLNEVLFSTNIRTINYE